MSRNLMFIPVVMVLMLFAGTTVFAQDEPAPEAAPAAEAAPGAAERVTEGLVALYRADSVTENGVLPDLSGTPEALDLVIRSFIPATLGIVDEVLVFGPPVEQVVPGVFSPEPAAGLVRAIKQSGKVTVEAWLASANIEQSGPTRIVTLESGQGYPNITLGQERSQFVLRLRTPAAVDWERARVVFVQPATPEESVVVGALQHVVVTFDGNLTVFYVDGEPVAETDEFAGSLEYWDEEMHLALGNQPLGERQYVGTLHLVALYAEALTPAQVKANFAAGL